MSFVFDACATSHEGLPYWFWVVDPAIRRCIVHGQAGSGDCTRTLSHGRTYGRVMLPSGCRATNLPFQFDRVR